MEDKEKELKKIEEEASKKEEEAKKKLKEAGLEAIFRVEVKKFGKSAHIIIPKQHLGKKAVVFIYDEEKFKKNSKTPQDDKK